MKDHRNPAGTAMSAALCAKALDLAIAPMRNVAREHGYSLAVHGSLARDIDLIAVPWVDRCSDADQLLTDLKGAVIGVFGRARLDPGAAGDWTAKPHGRRAKSIHVWCDGLSFYFDVSVMPTIAPPAEPVDG